MLFLAVDVYGGGLLPKNGRPPPGRPVASSQGDAWEMEKRRGQRPGTDHRKGRMAETLWPNGLLNKSLVERKKKQRGCRAAFLHRLGLGLVEFFSREKSKNHRIPQLIFIRARFRSWDLWVMGPPRFRCATLMLVTSFYVYIF